MLRPAAGGTGSAVGALLLLGACGGALGHRSVAEERRSFPLAANIDRVRIEIENGTLEVDSSLAREVSYAGGVRRAADTADALAAIERVGVGFSAAPDPNLPSVLVLRGPELPKGVAGVLGMEVGVRLPADLPLDVAIAGSGHVVVANRAAATHVATGRGDLRFERCQGGVEARTGRGNVIAFGHRGVLDVYTMIGDMQAFVREPAERIRLVTGQGTVQLHVPATIEFDLDARTELGRIGNGFGLEPERIGKYAAALVARRGAAHTKVVMRSAAGHLSIAPKTFD
jgi:hypothetical protein